MEDFKLSVKPYGDGRLLRAVFMHDALRPPNLFCRGDAQLRPTWHAVNFE